MKKKNPVILLPGSVRSTKGYLRVIQMLPQIVAKVGIFTLRISGGFKKGIHKEFISDFRKAITDSPYKNAINFDDKWISKDEYSAAFKSADLVLLPFEAGSFKNSINNAIKSGKPIICSDLKGFKEASLRNRRITIISSENELINAIGSILRW